jgi:hypothetical protein
MKDPETIARISHLAKAETGLLMARSAVDIATHNVGMVVPMDHPIAKALAEARLAIAKADVLTTQMLARFSR